MPNIPDDWNYYWYRCPVHDVKYHGSENCPVCTLQDGGEYEPISEIPDDFDDKDDDFFMPPGE